MKIEVTEIFETPIRRVVRDRSNPFEVFCDEEFKYRFCCRKETVLSLMQLLSADLEHGVPRNNFIPPILQIAATLRFYATGDFQITDRNLFGLSQPSVCRIIKRVSQAIASKKKHFITFPCGLAGQQVKQEFSTLRGFPGVIGCIDCTHIPIFSPGGDNAEIFRNRKGFFRLMCKQFVTLICLSQTSYAVGQAAHMIAAFLIIVLYALSLKIT